jgi:hypothetical protein
VKEAWLAKGVSLNELVEKQDGKFTLLQPTPEWPVVQIGASGGISLPEIKSYPRAYEAGLDGLELLRKQREREAKRATATAATPPPAKAVEPPQPTAKKPVTQPNEQRA